jgi:hypothetical protein
MQTFDFCRKNLQLCEVYSNFAFDEILELNKGNFNRGCIY